MEIEILLDLSQADPEQHQLIKKRLYKWHAEGAEIRYEKACFGGMSAIEEPYRYNIDLGQVDPVTAIRELHASLYRFGAKVYVHFVP